MRAIKIQHLATLTILLCSQLPHYAAAELRDLNNSLIKNVKHLSVIALWPEGSPGINTKIPEKIEPRGKRYYHIHNPNITLYKPTKANGVALILCAGGSYNYIASGVEGVPTAEKLNQAGITVFILKYRLPPDFRHPVPLSDALRAIQLVRHHAQDFKVDPNKIGIMGFSAGGHLASAAGTLFSKYSFGSDEVSKRSPRADFMALIYPVITTQKDLGHKSAHSLLPDDADNQFLTLLSNELNVSKETPATFLVHAEDDSAVTHQNSLLMHKALNKISVPSTLKLYKKGGHGFGIGRQGTDSQRWSEDFLLWLDKMKLLPQ